MPEIAKMLTEFTGQTFQRPGVHNLVRKLQKRFLVIDTETGEEKVEFRGVQVRGCKIKFWIKLFAKSFKSSRTNSLHRCLLRGWD